MESNGGRDPHENITLPIVTTLILNKDKGILLCKRKKPPFKGYWESTGGRIEPGENKEEAARRELFEETGIKANPRFMFQQEDRHEKYHRIAHCFYVIAEDKNVVLSEHDECQWFHPDNLPENTIPYNKKMIKKALSIIRI